MKTIIISSDRKKLDQVLKHENRGFLYVPVGYRNLDVENFLKEKGCKKIGIEKGLNGLDFKKEYISFIARLNRKYSSVHWWANSVSYKGTFVSDLYQEIYYYYCLVSLIEACEGGLIIVSSDSMLNDSIGKYCLQNNIKYAMLDSRKIYSRIIHLKRVFFAALCFLLRGWKEKFLISVYLRKKIKNSLNINAHYYVIRSWVDKRSFLIDGAYKDPYFGRLPEYIIGKNKRLIIMVGSLTGYKSLIDKIKDTKEFLLVPQEYFAGYTDYLKAIVFTFFNKPKVSKKIIFCNIEITDLVTGHLRKDYENNEVTNNRMYYYYTKGLLKNSKVENFIYLFENRAWERMSIVALRKYSSSTRIIGYVHSSVRQSFLAYFQGEEEKNLVPSPDRILTTGKEPRIMLRQAGNYGDKVKLSEACALRYEYFFANKRIERRKEGKILVTFPIEVSSSFKLLDFLNDTFSCNNEYRVVLRSHPFTPVEILLKKSSLKLSDNFEISNSVSLRQDLENSAVLIYVDSTSSMEALACGIPVIHVDLKGPLNHDPLFDLNSLKWTASNKEELLIAIDCISKMDNEEFLEKHSRAVSYLKEYFYPVQEDYLKEFIR